MKNVNYAFIGDIHSQISALRKALNYCNENGCIPVLLGDLFDSRMKTSDSVAVYNTVRQAVENGAIALRSNHQNKLERYARGNNVLLKEGFDRTVRDFQEAGICLTEVGQWLETFPYGIALRDSRGVEYRCAHAMFPRWVLVPENYDGIYRVNEVTRKAKDYMLYGPRRAGAVWPQDETRVYWWEEESDRDWVRVAGHYHHVHVSDKSLVLDGQMGGSTQEGFDPAQARLCVWNLEEQTLTQFT
jgi:hypothetical protein